MINNKALLSKKEFIKATSLVALPDISLDPEEADKFIDYIEIGRASCRERV